MAYDIFADGAFMADLLVQYVALTLTVFALQLVGSVTEPPQKGVRRQDQLERFSTKREHNQHTSVQYHIIHSSGSYYNLSSRISYTKRFEDKISLQKI
jgi:hypothetical protein